MGTKRKSLLVIALFILLIVSLTGCETVMAILETPIFPQYYTNEQGVASITNPEQIFTVKISDPLILEIPIARSGHYEFINMEHPDILLYMGLYSKDITRKDIIAENIIGDKPMDRLTAYLEAGESYLVGIGTLSDNLLGRYGYFQLKQVEGPKSVEPVLTKPVEKKTVPIQEEKVEPVALPPEPVESPVLYITNPEEPFTAKITDTLVFGISPSATGRYDLINLDHPDSLLYMALFSMDEDEDEALAENVTGDEVLDRLSTNLVGGESYLVGIGVFDKDLIGKEGSFLLQRADEEEVIPPPATEPVPLTDPVKFKDVDEASSTSTVSFQDPSKAEVTAREMAPFRDSSEQSKNILSGTISGVLTKENSPYLAKGRITVADGTSLIVEDGVVIRMAKDSFLEVKGTLETRGKPGQEVVFVGENPSESGFWAHIKFLGDSTGMLQSTRIIGSGAQQVVEGGWRKSSLILSDSAQVTLVDCEVAGGTESGIELFKTAKADISSTTFKDLDVPVILHDLSAVPTRMVGNRFINLKEYGVRVTNDVVRKGTHATLRYTNNLPYIFTQLRIDEGATLDIERFTSLKFKDNGQLLVQGTLNVQGQSDYPVIFTSYTDDVAFDTNNDGKATKPSQGAWGGLLFTESADGNLDYVSIRYAGGDRVYSGAWRKGAVLVGNTATPRITNSEIIHSKGCAVMLLEQAKPTITNTTFKDSQYPIEVSDAKALTGSLKNNSSIEMEYKAVHLNISTIPRGSSVTLQNWDNLPYVAKTVDVRDSGRLTLNPAVTLKMQGNSSLNVEGSLVTKGSEDYPVTITSYRDDVSGDSNGDGENTIPGRGDWIGLVFKNEGKGEINYTRIYWAGAQTVVSGAWREGSFILADNASATIDHSVIAESKNTALLLCDNASASLSYSTIRDTDWVMRIADYRAMQNSLGNNSYQNILHEGIKLDVHDVPSGLSINLISQDYLPLVSGSINIKEGASVTILGGTYLKMEGDSYISNSGTLDILGTGSTPVIITSYKDDLRNDTNGDGNATKPNAGDWVGIIYNPGSTGTIDASKIMYAGAQKVVSGAWRKATFITLGSTKPLFRNGEILHSAGDGILVLDQASPTFGDLRFTDIAGVNINKQ
ncbi:MAG: right-handed parallel beta-helix repeat-containing protein [Sphaerochaeta sp.]